MRFLLVSAGSHGDIHPFVALGSALRARGHDATLATNPYYRGLAEDTSLGFVAMGESFDLADLKSLPEVMSELRGPGVVIREMMAPFVRECLVALPGILREGAYDAVVHHHICPGAAWAAAEAGLPSACVALAPLVWFSRHEHIVGSGAVPSRLPGWLGWLPALRSHLLRPVLRHMFDRPLNEVLRELGRPPRRDIFLGVFREARLNLGLWSPVLRGALADDPPDSHIVGFPWHDRLGSQEHPEAEAAEFLTRCEASGKAPVMFTLGTAAVHVPGRFYHHAAEACRRLGRPGMLLVGRSGLTITGVPGDVRTFTYLPFSRVMPRCACIVHHGGIGTTAQALRSGRASVVCAHAHDQHDNAARVDRLGVGVRMTAKGVSPASLCRAIARAIDDRDMNERARALGAAIAREDGGSAAVALIESLVRSGAGRDVPGARP